MKKIWALDDEHRWGQNIKMAASRLGFGVELFSRIGQLHESEVAGVTFVRTTQVREKREQCRGLILELNRLGFDTLPSKKDALRYDDKVYQYGDLKPWLPETHIITSRDKALELMNNKNWKYPFISKSKEGASSAAVRIVEDAMQARMEVEAVFSPQGIRTQELHSSYERIQTDYLYWQEFCAGNDHDIRVCRIGNYYFGLVRQNRKDRPMASGSGVNWPFTNIHDPEIAACMSMSRDISNSMDTKLVCFDFVFKNGRPYVLECSSSWTPSAYSDCPVWECKNKGGNIYYWEKVDLKGAHMFEMIALVLQEMAS